MRKLSHKQYELTNHLGNVLSTVLDRKTPITSSGGSGGSGSTTITHYEGDVVFASDYYPFGSPMSWTTSDSIGGRLYSGGGYRYGFNGQEKDDELGAGVTTAEFWMYDGKLGRRWNVDPLANERMSWSPFNTMRCNPIRNIDPKGALDIEYDKDGNKLSDLGGDKIDFHHQENGNTKIVDRESGATNIIRGGEKIIRGYTLRNANTSWSTITKEFIMQQGVTNSMFADFDGNSSSGPFKSLHNALSSYSGPAREQSINSPLIRGNHKMDYFGANPIVANDMWEQMWGRTIVSWYKLDNKTLFLMYDSKSFKSLTYRAGDDWNRSSFTMMGNTYQTYIWIEDNTTIQSKIAERNLYRQNKLKQQEREIQFRPKY